MTILKLTDRWSTFGFGWDRTEESNVVIEIMDCTGIKVWSWRWREAEYYIVNSYCIYFIDISQASKWWSDRKQIYNSEYYPCPAFYSCTTVCFELDYKTIIRTCIYKYVQNNMSVIHSLHEWSVTTYCSLRLWWFDLSTNKN